MRSPRRRSVLALLGVSAAAAAAVPLLTLATGAPPLPDLVSESPALSTDARFNANPAPRPYSDGRLLLRFDGYVTNSASAGSSLEIRASGANAGNGYVMQNVQQIGGATSPGVGGSVVDNSGGLPTPVVRFEAADDHNHYHLKNAAEYSLWNKDKTAQVAIAQKTEAGFCLEDTLWAGGDGPATYTTSAAGNAFCWQNDRDHAGTLVMGISPGWKDLYNAGLTYQWVDVSNTQPGEYNLAERVDPTNVIRESNESNNGYAFLPYTLAGYVASNVSTSQTGSARSITLGATKFGTPSVCPALGPNATPDPCTSAARQFKILTPPQHGTLSKSPSDGTFSDSSVTYRPNPGYTGSDTFTYAAVTAGWPYPLNPAPATVTIAGTTAAVAISGAPASLVAGTSAQLSASVVGAPPGVNWSASAGTISADGLYVAPSTPPAGGSVTITASSAASPNLKGSVAIAITAASTAPAPTAVSRLPTTRPLLSSLRTGHVGKRVIVGKVVTGNAAGTLKFTATIKKTVLGRCTIKAKANKTVSCRIVLKRAYPLKKVTMTAQLKVGKKSIVRRAYIIK